ncbi:unnamed protein product, partial [Rotaria magnacalcarata]
MCGVIDP